MLINLSSQYAPWLPSRLFANGQQGVWYVPQPVYRGDQVLYQDSAGTTPVTADGQPVGYMQDLSGNGNHATQDTASYKPIYRTDGTLHWLEFDGVDDWLVTPSIDFSASDEITASAGVRIESNARSAFLELSESFANAGTFGLFTPWLDGQYAFVSKNLAVSSASYIEPSSNVLTGIAKRSTDHNVLRIDGLIDGTNTNDQGAGNFGAYPMYIGMRAGNSIPYTGRAYGIIVSGEVASDPSKHESYIANLAGVTL